MTASLCKVCGYQPAEVVSRHDRDRYLPEIVRALALWTATSPYERGINDALCKQMSRASVYATLCLASDLGWCVPCLQKEYP